MVKFFLLCLLLLLFKVFSGGSDGKNMPAMRETWDQSPGWEDPLEEGMAVHYSILASRIPKDRGAWRVAVHGVPKSHTTEQLSAYTNCLRSER